MFYVSHLFPVRWSKLFSPHNASKANVTETKKHENEKDQHATKVMVMVGPLLGLAIVGVGVVAAFWIRRKLSARCKSVLSKSMW